MEQSKQGTLLGMDAQAVTAAAQAQAQGKQMMASGLTTIAGAGLAKGDFFGGLLGGGSGGEDKEEEKTQETG